MGETTENILHKVARWYHHVWMAYTDDDSKLVLVLIYLPTYINLQLFSVSSFNLSSRRVGIVEVMTR